MTGETGCAAVTTRDGERFQGDADALVFLWWSFTKTIIAAAALRSAEQNRVDLDAFLPGKRYSLRGLLRHTAGVPNYSRLQAYHGAVFANEAPWTTEDLIRRVDADRLRFEPGEGWEYSNTGYALAVRGLERASGEDVGALLRRLVLAPLGVGEAEAFVPTAREELAAACNRRVREGYHSGWVYHGLLVGVPTAACAALHRLMTGDLLSGTSLVALQDRIELGGPLPDRPWRTCGYGTGVMSGTFDDPEGGPPFRVLGHSGDGPGSGCAVYHRPADGERPAATAAVFAPFNPEHAAECWAARLLARA